MEYQQLQLEEQVMLELPIPPKINNFFIRYSYEECLKTIDDFTNLHITEQELLEKQIKDLYEYNIEI
jgi:hypothetical protein